MPISSATTNYGDDDRIESSEQHTAPSQDLAALAAASAAMAGEAKDAMDELEKRGEWEQRDSSENNQVAAEISAEDTDDIPLAAPELPQVNFSDDKPPPVAEVMALPPDVAGNHGRQMDRLTTKIPKRKPVESSRPTASRRERAANTPHEQMTAKQKRTLPKSQLNAMHDLTAKAQELGGEPVRGAEIGGLDEADAEVVAMPREDTPEALKRRWKDKEEASKEFNRAIVALHALEAEAISECTRQIERIHSQLERTRYY